MSDDERLIKAVKLLERATMQVGDLYANARIRVVRRDEAEAIIRNALTVPATRAEALSPMRWKTLAKHAPEEGTAVLCYWPGMVDGQAGVIGVAVYARPGLWHEVEDDEDDFREPTYWMPLPAAPETISPQFTKEEK